MTPWGGKQPCQNIENFTEKMTAYLHWGSLQKWIPWQAFDYNQLIWEKKEVLIEKWRRKPTYHIRQWTKIPMFSLLKIFSKFIPSRLISLKLYNLNSLTLLLPASPGGICISTQQNVKKISPTHVKECLYFTTNKWPWLFFGESTAFNEKLFFSEISGVLFSTFT